MADTEQELDLKTLIERLQGYEVGCEDKCLDLRGLQFEAKEGELRLYNPNHSYYFKSDPKNPRGPKIIHGARQFCKLMKVPYSFFAKNPEYMKNSMVSCWLPTLKPEEAMIMAKLRRTKEENKDIIRAILPVEFTNLPNHELMSIISETVDAIRRISSADIMGTERPM